MTASWEEQRHIGLYAPLEALGPQSELAAAVRAEWRELRPAETTHTSLAADGFAEFDAPTTSVRLGAATVRVDVRGALLSLVDGSGRERAGAGGLGLLQYQTLVLKEFFGWWKEYLLNYNEQHPELTSGWNEYGKPGGFMSHGLPGNKTVQATLATPTVRSAWRRTGTTAEATRSPSSSPFLRSCTPTLVRRASRGCAGRRQPASARAST